jgi:hypothetical protein
MAVQTTRAKVLHQIIGKYFILPIILNLLRGSRSILLDVWEGVSGDGIDGQKLNQTDAGHLNLPLRKGALMDTHAINEHGAL